MYKIKQVPEDFIVEEVSDIKLYDEEKDFLVFELKKKNSTTEDAVQCISKKINIPRKNLSYAGNKDKQAVTTQLISIKSGKNVITRAENLQSNNLKLKFRGYSAENVFLGCLRGNNFTITIRNLDENFNLNQLNIRDWMVNYFDEQRFSKNNVEIGRLILKKDFKGAVDEILRNKGNYEASVENFLIQNPKNYNSALQKVPRKILLIFVHAFQSYLFNRIASEYAKKISDKYKILKNSLGELRFPLKKPENISLPLPGFDLQIEKPEIQKIMNEILAEESILFEDFIIRSIQNLSVAGFFRDFLIDISNLEISQLDSDDFNIGMKKLTLKFYLPKGSYATLYVKTLFMSRHFLPDFI